MTIGEGRRRGGTWRGCATSRHESFFGSMDGLVRCMRWMESIYIIGCIVSWPARKERRLFCQMRTLLGWVLGLRHMVAVSYSSALPYVRAECRIHSKLKGSIIGDIIRDFFKREHITCKPIPSCKPCKLQFGPPDQHLRGMED